MSDRRCVTDVNPDGRARIPGEDHFDRDFMPAPELETIAAALIAAYPDELGHLNNFNIRVVWKKKGGGSGNRMRRGKCQLASGLLGMFSEADFIVWIAADTMEAVEITNWQLEALIFHELSFASFKLDSNGEMKPAIKPVDFEGHRAEIDLYGLWSNELREARILFDQLPMPLVRPTSRVA